MKLKYIITSVILTSYLFLSACSMSYSNKSGEIYGKISQINGDTLVINEGKLVYEEIHPSNNSENTLSNINMRNSAYMYQNIPNPTIFGRLDPYPSISMYNDNTKIKDRAYQGLNVMKKQVSLTNRAKTVKIDENSILYGIDTLKIGDYVNIDINNGTARSIRLIKR